MSWADPTEFWHGAFCMDMCSVLPCGGKCRVSACVLRLYHGALVPSICHLPCGCCCMAVGVSSLAQFWLLSYSQMSVGVGLLPYLFALCGCV